MSRNVPELSVVIPAYNEESAIGSVVDEWAGELEQLRIDYELLAYDDGSRDGTCAALERLAAGNPRIRVASHTNRGHGPTVLRGYREARGAWVFQIDADGEMTPEGFEPLWRRRDGFDLLLGYRTGRRSGWSRRTITACARASVRMLFGARLRDVNAPYRLMRASSLRQMLPDLDENTFAPNVILAGMAARRGLRVDEQPVRHRSRRGGVPSLERLELWRSAARAMGQTVAAALREARRR